MGNTKELIEKNKKLINWRELSRLLAGNPNSVRADNVLFYSKHQSRVKELLQHIEQWKNKD